VSTHLQLISIIIIIINLGAECRWLVNATTWPFYPLERPGIYCTEGWVGLRAGLNGCGKSSSPGFDLRTFQPVASRYSDWPIPSRVSFIANVHIMFTLEHATKAQRGSRINYTLSLT
jgi:hypothetical protein